MNERRVLELMGLLCLVVGASMQMMTVAGLFVKIDNGTNPPGVGLLLLTVGMLARAKKESGR